MAYSIGDGRNIKSLLGGTVKYIIPRYQRQYIWDDKHWQDLFDDLLFVYNNKSLSQDINHFFSTFIFEKSGSIQGIDCFNVIDGQQRLSTTMIILSIICRICSEKKDKTKHSMFAQYLSARDSKGEYIKIDNNQSDLLGTIIEDNCTFHESKDLEKIDIKKYHSYSNEQKNIYKCYIFFYQKITELIKDDSLEKELNNLMAFANSLLEMQIVQIIVEKEQEGYDIFEILNARGTPLAQHELLKNYIFKFYKPTGDLDIAKQTWQEMEKLLTVKNTVYLPNYIGHYTIQKYTKPDKTNTVLRIIKKANQKNSTKTILEDLYKKSKYYRWIILPEDILCCDLFDKKAVKENIYSVLLYFSLKNQSQFRPLLLSLFAYVEEAKTTYDTCLCNCDGSETSKAETTLAKNNYRKSEDEVSGIFTYLLNFFMVEVVIKKQQPKVFEQNIHELSQMLEKDRKAINEIKNKLRINITKDMFINSFCLLGYSNKVTEYKRIKTGYDIRQLMRMYEAYLQSSDELMINNMTIEHIANDSKEDITTCYIGNLIPLAESIQTQIGATEEFKKKMPFYKQSNFKTVLEFVQQYSKHSTWTSEKIQDRSKKLAEVFYTSIFKLQ